MLTNENKVIGLTLTVIATCAIILGILLSISILIIIFYQFFLGQIKQEEKPIIILSINIYLQGIACMVLMLSFNARTILGDIYEKEFDTPSCVIIGYLYISFLEAYTISFINQVNTSYTTYF